MYISNRKTSVVHTCQSFDLRKSVVRIQTNSRGISVSVLPTYFLCLFSNSNDNVLLYLVLTANCPYCCGRTSHHQI